MHRNESVFGLLLRSSIRLNSLFSCFDLLLHNLD
jgi:hypothetical protein